MPTGQSSVDAARVPLPAPEPFQVEVPSGAVEDLLPDIFVDEVRTYFRSYRG